MQAPVAWGELLDLEGQPRQKIIEELGVPTDQFRLGDQEFLMYETSKPYHRYKVVMFFIIPVYYEELPPTKKSIGCLRIELDSMDLMKSYEFRRLITGASQKSGYNCRASFIEGGGEDRLKNIFNDLIK